MVYGDPDIDPHTEDREKAAISLSRSGARVETKAFVSLTRGRISQEENGSRHPQATCLAQPSGLSVRGSHEQVDVPGGGGKSVHGGGAHAAAYHAGEGGATFPGVAGLVPKGSVLGRDGFQRIGIAVGKDEHLQTGLVRGKLTHPRDQRPEREARDEDSSRRVRT